MKQSIVKFKNSKGRKLAMVTIQKCGFCEKPLQHIFVDLGVQPFCESYLEADKLNQMEPFYPLKVYFCDNCLLVQLEGSMTPKELFNSYAYFSSHSKGWMKHIESYAEMIITKLGLNNKSQVVEIGSNDGYLLQFFAQRGIPVVGVEPASNVAEEAIKKGIPTIVKFFDKETCNDLIKENKKADLLVGNNILAQVPDLTGFVANLKSLLTATGVITIEFHHIMNLINKNQFDTISHERFTYLSFTVIEKIFTSLGLTIFNVEEIPTHGGSLRIYARHTEDSSRSVELSVAELRKKELANGLNQVGSYLSFNEKTKKTRRKILAYLLELKNNNKLIIGYGAHAEANTLLNYLGVRSDFLDYTVDRNPYKQGKFLGGSRIPIYNPDEIKETKPDFIFILPWSIKVEIMNQMSYIKEWGGKFIIPLPEIAIYDSNGNQINNGIFSEENK
jgi:2-polyprenyl-3-methyl-5-hydroxy-6-metoxy-1,4-benzoquinol methylase